MVEPQFMMSLKPRYRMTLRNSGENLILSLVPLQTGKSITMDHSDVCQCVFFSSHPHPGHTCTTS